MVKARFVTDICQVCIDLSGKKSTLLLLKMSKMSQSPLSCEFMYECRDESRICQVGVDGH